MEPTFWHARWQNNEIGFHEGQANTWLTTYWPQLSPETQSGKVLVPLCGKTHDLHWLVTQGHPVLGVELSEIACQDFFKEAGLHVEPTPCGAHLRFQSGALNLLCGDFFQLDRESAADIRRVYDRAALIALPPAMREAYARHLSTLLPDGTEMLLITLDYPEGQMKGPPFNVSDAEVKRLYGDAFDIEQLAHIPMDEANDFARRRGLSGASEGVFRLKKRS